LYTKVSCISIETLDITLGEITMSQTPSKPDPGSPPPVPRWVKVFGIIFILLIVLVVAVHLAGVNFGHMPHMP
jgi:ABC-type phosphate/phosphonate transport system permease subunit